MRMLVALAVAVSLAACTRQADNDMGRPPPETGRAAPPDSGMKPRVLPDTMTGQAGQMQHDSM
jgi:hypothetical protein